MHCRILLSIYSYIVRAEIARRTPSRGGGEEGTVMTEEPLTGRGYRRVCILATRQHVFHTQTHTHLRIRSLMHNNEQGKTLICAVAQAGPHSLGAEDKWRGNTLG